MARNDDELLCVIRQIQALKLELDTLRRLGEPSPEAREKERALDRLHWRLAGVARRAASNDLGAAA